MGTSDAYFAFTHDLNAILEITQGIFAGLQTWNSNASNPLKTNSNSVFKFSGLGEVINMLEYLHVKKKTRDIGILGGLNTRP